MATVVEWTDHLLVVWYFDFDLSEYDGIDSSNPFANDSNYVSSYEMGVRYYWLSQILSSYSSYKRNHWEVIFYGMEWKLTELNKLYQSLESKRKIYNKNYVEEEMIRNEEYFDLLESYPLDDLQRSAILHDENNNLVVAGAGTWKTTTIAWKACYLIEKKWIDPKDILMLSFTRDATIEMKDRMKALLDDERVIDEIDIKTFHSLGYTIVSRSEWIKKDVIEEYRILQFVEKTFQESLQNKEFLSAVVEYFLYYLHPKVELEQFDNKDQYLKYLKKTLKTLNNITVKSYEELMIANFLFASGIKFEYERKYQIDTRTAENRQYKPDFYLSDYDIYLEHYALRKNWTSHFENYVEWVNRKRELHKKHKTNCLETYSWENSEGRLIENLKLKLAKAGVEMNIISDDQILRRIKASSQRDIVSGFTKLVNTFMNLYKWSWKQFAELTQSTDDIRTQKFLRIFKYIYTKYEHFLETEEMIDFNDMVWKAVQYVADWAFQKQYKYILIDEFQDVSLARYELIKSFVEASPATKTFCVWDDWQSIFRFAGSRIDIFTNFDQYFWPTHTTLLEKTFRFNRWISLVSSDFITKNPAQKKKTLKTLDQRTEWVMLMMERDSQDSHTVLDEYFSQLNNQWVRLSIFVIVRYNFQKKLYPQSDRRTRYPNLYIDVLSAHKAKWLGADFVIVDYLDHWLYWFPSEIEDDPVLNVLLDNTDTYFHAEERRLFYVALTRTKNSVMLLATKWAESVFYRELREKYGDWESKEEVKCPDCTARMIVRSWPYGEFYSCENYPLCYGKRKIIKPKQDW